MSRFLVTGGAGFIGSHIVRKLLEKGHSVRVLDNFSSGREENLSSVSKDIELIRDDICSKDACLSAAKDIDYVLHQAALRSVPKSMKSPREYNDVNISGTLNILQASLESGVKRLVFASSSSVYGDVDEFPEREDFVPQPISPYALSKLTGEHYCKIFSRHYNLETVSLRYFNVFGPRQSLDDEYAVVIPRFIDCLLRDKPTPIYGTGKQSRDFTYVSNVVQANILAAERQSVSGQVFNVSSGKDYTVLQLAEILNKITGKEIEPVFLEPRQGDVFRTLSDLSNAKEALGFEPEVDFLEGLNLTVDYFKNA